MWACAYASEIKSNPTFSCACLVLQFQVSVSMQESGGLVCETIRARSFRARAAFSGERASLFCCCLLPPWRRKSGARATSQSQASGSGRRERVWSLRTSRLAKAAARLRSAGPKQMPLHRQAQVHPLQQAGLPRGLHRFRRRGRSCKNGTGSSCTRAA